jgi:hypothetical protein
MAKVEDTERWSGCNVEELDHDVRMVRVFHHERPHETVGVEYEHPDGKGGKCLGWINFKGRGFDDGWEVISEMPLTLAPSLLCRACGHHGFIRDGKWVPA